MEREILFRGKRLSNGEWVKGFYCHIPHGRYGQDEHLIQTIKNNGKIGTLERVDPASAGQYTGLTDKNGVKIFEGDILRTREWEGKRTAVVIFENGMFRAHRMSLVTWTVNPGIYNCEIIGNIHDNPELLDSKYVDDGSG